MTPWKHLRRSVVPISLLAFLALFLAPPPASAGDMPVTWLLSQTNGAVNRIIVYADRGSGPVTVVKKYPTGGKGTQGRLHNAAPMAVDSLGRILAVDAGSDQVSIASLDNSTGALRILGHFDSLGRVPVSIAVQGDLIYVLNSGMIDYEDPLRRIGPAVVQGFRMSADGTIVAIPGARAFLPRQCSTYPCFGNSLPVQVGITPDRRNILVTDTALNAVFTARLDGRGRPGALVAQDAPGAFGFDISADGLVGLSAFPETGNGYAVTGHVERGRWIEVSERVLLPVPGACWTAWNPQATRLYVASARAKAGTTDTFISTLRNASNGRLSDAYDAAVPLPKVRFHPLDLAFTPTRLYNAVRTGVHVFDIQANGNAIYRPDLEGKVRYADGMTGMLAISGARG